MNARAILVEFVVRPEDRAHSRALILENAAASLNNETGCLRFDVLEDAAEPGRFVLYELYANATDFEAHLRTPHFGNFSDATRNLFVSRSIRQLDLQDSG